MSFVSSTSFHEKSNTVIAKSDRYNNAARRTNLVIPSAHIGVIICATSEKRINTENIMDDLLHGDSIVAHSVN